ncbi:MAG TPA: hypothetical protein VG269_17375 [Tepidisphaeraceae bacterium]|nr:hypothetical protein [Tepidisphaeraceae bacterium]
MIDIDAHHGETDALDAARWIQSTYFPDSYLEPSRRGYHLYVAVRVGHCNRARFNVLMDLAETKLQRVVSDTFDAKVELSGRFNLWQGNKLTSRAKPFQAPLCTGGMADVNRLRAMPVYLLAAFKSIVNDADAMEEFDFDTQTSSTVEPLPPSRRHRKSRPVPKDENCAFKRMNAACFTFTENHHRLPTFDELLAHYETVYVAGATHPARTKRAKDVIRFRSRKFDPDRQGDGGYAEVKPQLMHAVETHCDTQTSSTEEGVSAEDLCIALYAYTVNSFQTHENPRRQWSIGYDAIMQMFEKLNAEGLTDRTCKRRNKILAIRTTLLDAGLIECLDRRYIPSKDGTGVAQKYSIGRHHWRYAEFVKFANGVKVEYVGDAKIIDAVQDEVDAITRETTRHELLV